MTPATSRGTCPDALAVEVYKHTTDLVTRRLRSSPLMAQAVPDAVGEVFRAWLATPSDKTKHPAGLLAQFLVRRVFDLLFGTSANRRKRRGAIRSIASHESTDPERADREDTKRETLYRAYYGEPDPLACEDHRIDDLDFIAGKREETASDKWPGPLRFLLTCGWSRTQLGLRLGVSRQSIDKWLSGRYVPHSSRRAEVMDLVERGELPPSPLTAATLQPTPRPRTPVPATWRTHLIVLKDRGWSNAQIARRIRVAEPTLRRWAAGENAPSDKHGAAVTLLDSLVANHTLPDETPLEALLREQVETFRAKTAHGPARVGDIGLNRCTLEKLVALGIAERVLLPSKHRPNPVGYAPARPSA